MLCLWLQTFGLDGGKEICVAAPADLWLGVPGWSIVVSTHFSSIFYTSRDWLEVVSTWCFVKIWLTLRQSVWLPPKRRPLADGWLSASMFAFTRAPSSVYENRVPNHSIPDSMCSGPYEFGDLVERMRAVFPVNPREETYLERIQYHKPEVLRSYLIFLQV